MLFSESLTQWINFDISLKINLKFFMVINTQILFQNYQMLKPKAESNCSSIFKILPLYPLSLSFSLFLSLINTK